MKLSILIASLHSRSEMLSELKNEFRKQIQDDVQIISIVDDGENSIGYKRNELMKIATGDYVCFFDDDDTPSSNYVSLLLKGIESGADCCSLRGVITWDGLNPEIFEHSLRYCGYKTTANPITYERYPNHLNCIKRSIANKFHFPELNHGEDSDWALQIHKSVLIKTEYFIDEVIYHYKYKTNK